MTNYSKSAVFAIVRQSTIAKPSKMQNIKFYCLITEYFATASPMKYIIIAVSSNNLDSNHQGIPMHEG